MTWLGIESTEVGFSEAELLLLPCPKKSGPKRDRKLSRSSSKGIVRGRREPSKVVKVRGGGKQWTVHSKC